MFIIRGPAPRAKNSSTAGAMISASVLPGSYAATLSVDQPGPWELALDDGQSVARIPFIVPARVVAPWEKATYGGFVAAGALLLVALVTAVRTRRGWVALLPAAGVVAAVSVGVTGAVLSASTPQPPQPGAQLDPTIDNVTNPYASLSIVDYSRPPVNLVAQADATSGAPTNLELSVTDGATGRPVDDLLVHDSALMHLMILSPSGELWHLHPIRTSPGAYEVRFTPPEPGSYAITAELARRGGGVQLARTVLEVKPGKEIPGPPTAAASIGTTIASAGSPSTITARFGNTADLQPWLGMLGHLIIVGPGDPPIWAHAHAMIPITPGSQPDETVAAYGPDVTFTYTFPLPGRYRLWIQAERDYSVLTVPATVDVPATAGAAK